MNKRSYLPIIILILAVALSGCNFQVTTGSGKVVTETRQVASFSGISLSGIGDVYVTQSNTTSLRIEAEDNLIPLFETTVNGDTLTIGIKNDSFGTILRPTKPVKFFVSTPDVKALTISGSGNIITTDITSTDLKITLSGSGNITNTTVKADSINNSLSGSGNIDLGVVTADSVKSTISGSGNISLSGQVTSQDAGIIGSGDYIADDLQSQDTTINVTGSGEGRVWATGNLTVSITGSGNVTYHGSPTVSTSVTGSGHVNSSGK